MPKPRKPIRLHVAHVARKLLVLQEISKTNAVALLVRGDGTFEVYPAPDGDTWLAVGYGPLQRGSKRGAERTARLLINRAAEHLARYPNLFHDSIVKVAAA
jgi:hypothetical protein